MEQEQNEKNLEREMTRESVESLMVQLKKYASGEYFGVSFASHGYYRAYQEFYYENFGGDKPEPYWVDAVVYAYLDRVGYSEDFDEALEKLRRYYFDAKESIKKSWGDFL